MRFKNSQFLVELFSFHDNPMALIFLVRKSISRYGVPQSPFLKLVTFLNAKGEHKFHDSKNAPKTVA